MPDTNSKSQGTQPPPELSRTGHPLPRRPSPKDSFTLRHHRLARDASLRASPGSVPARVSSLISSPRRNSSGDSHETGQSDPKKWFDQSNEHAIATFNNMMEVDPPFFQKESDSSNEDKAYEHLHPPPRLTAKSSSAGDYRSVIDDLTVEIHKLKEELKHYKQKGPDPLRKEKLFEIKIHSLPKRKKRELEATLRDFAAGLGDSPNTSVSQRKKSSRHATREGMYSGSGSFSKHASSSSGSNARPVDSAYASMSTGANSSGTSLGRPSVSSRSKTSEEKIENYLRDIPEGLYPRHVAMTEKEKKRLVVRRLEQLFTGKIGGRTARRPLATSPDSGVAQALSLNNVVADTSENQGRPMVHQPPSLAGVAAGTVAAAAAEAAREARILPSDQQSGQPSKKNRSRDNGSASNSNGDQTESGGDGNSGNSSGPGLNTSPSMPPPPDQRPTRPADLDPDRVQVPSDNMDYIRHLGLVPPELLAESAKMQDVSPDADGWVYLNLLCSLAQLHIINVTPDFVRIAVSEMSTKFQLSPDGRKIRWRGGMEGTRFSSDGSATASQRSNDSDETEISQNNGQRKRQKTGQLTSKQIQYGGSSADPSKFGAQVSASSDSFHYKPLFVQQDSSDTQRSSDEAMSSLDPAAEDSNIGDSRWGLSGSGNTSNRRKRRHDGAIIYYSGAPFCADLSGDAGDVSPATYMLSSGQDHQETQVSHARFDRSTPSRSHSGSWLKYRPLSEMGVLPSTSSKMDIDGSHDVPGLTTDSTSDLDESDWEFPWSDEQQHVNVQPLESCGLGGVVPDDHFVVVVSTKRPKADPKPSTRPLGHSSSDKTTDGIVGRLACMTSSFPMPMPAPAPTMAFPIQVEYISGRIRRLKPVPLPPPATFFPPFSTDSSGDTDDDSSSTDEDDDDKLKPSEFTSRRAEPQQSDDYPDGVDLSSGDEDGEDPDDEASDRRLLDRATDTMERHLPDRRRRNSQRSRSSATGSNSVSGSSAATAGGVESGYSSSVEESH